MAIGGRTTVGSGNAGRSFDGDFTEVRREAGRFHPDGTFDSPTMALTAGLSGS
jgi:hypothetical protein